MLIAGVDEVGRGPLAGPVVTAAVILDPKRPIEGLQDSKKLSEKKREYLAHRIESNALCYAYGRAEVDEIDRLNILQASLLAMQRAIQRLTVQPDLVQVDGLFCPQIDIPVEAIVKGDQKILAISAASILAKVKRDFEMATEVDRIYPQYGFALHKGYGTKQHIEALRRYGITPAHRRSFNPVKQMLQNTGG